MKYFVANWKANKNLADASDWITEFSRIISQDAKLVERLTKEESKVIVCPPFPLIEPLKKLLTSPLIALGAQDVSSFEKGSYTGEVTALTLNGLVEYAILGHSERRKFFNESDDALEKKIVQCKANQIEPILCVRGTGDKIYAEATVVAYEPVEAIGSGQNAAVEDVITMKSQLNLAPNQAFLYGGSVNKDTITPYITSPEIDGVLVGGASLDPNEFYALLVAS